MKQYLLFMLLALTCGASTFCAQGPANPNLTALLKLLSEKLVTEEFVPFFTETIHPLLIADYEDHHASELNDLCTYLYTRFHRGPASSRSSWFNSGDHIISLEDQLETWTIRALKKIKPEEAKKHACLLHLQTAIEKRQAKRAGFELVDRES